MNNVSRFLESLDPNRMYKVENNSNYQHVLPKDMTMADIQELMSRKQTRGDKSLLEGSIMYKSVLLG